MKNNLVIILNALLIFMLCFGCSRSNYSHIDSKSLRKDLKVILQKEKAILRTLPRQTRQYTHGMRLVPGGGMRTVASPYFELTERDTNLLRLGYFNHNWVRVVNLQDFFISKTEVTVDEYYEFVVWAIDSVLLTRLAQYDPSYYLDEETKRLNWDKKAILESRDSAFIRIIEPLTCYSLASNCFTSKWFQERKSYSGQYVIMDSIRFKYVYGSDTLDIPVFPDQNVFSSTNIFVPGSYGLHYFTIPHYSNHPIIGVTWHQANAYCHWLTQQARNYAGNNQLAQSIVFRLPTEAEWEYAASSKPVFGRTATWLYPWGTNFFQQNFRIRKKGNNTIYNANFGWFIDANNLRHKFPNSNSPLHPVDGDFYTPNLLGLHHMAGNVAEWTSDSVFFAEFKLWDEAKARHPFDKVDNYRKYFDDEDEWNAYLKDTEINWEDDMQSAMEKIWKRHAYPISKAVTRGDTILHNKDLKRWEINPNYKSYQDSFKLKFWHEASLELDDAKITYHNQQVISRNSPGRIVKGGSWYDSPVYLIIGNREYIPENHASARIGFRVVMTINSEE